VSGGAGVETIVLFVSSMAANGELLTYVQEELGKCPARAYLPSEARMIYRLEHQNTRGNWSSNVRLILERLGESSYRSTSSSFRTFGDRFESVYALSFANAGN